MRNATVRLIENTIVVVHTAAPPSMEEWSTYIDTVLDGGRAFGGDLTRCRQLVITDGGGPNSMQRAQAQKAAAQMNGALMPVAVVSASTFVRGIVTAFNWFNMNLRAFSPSEVKAAFAFLELDPQVVRSIWVELASMQAELGPVETIQNARDSFQQS